MMNKMNKEQLQKIKDRCEAATPGPWCEEKNRISVLSNDPYGKGEMLIADIRGWGHLTGRGHGACKMEDDKAIAIQEANLAFIAAARQDIPALLAYIEELEARLGCIFGLVNR